MKAKELPKEIEDILCNEDINLEAAEAQHGKHLDGECPKDCPWCLDEDAADPLLVQHRRVFDRLFGGGK